MQIIAYINILDFIKKCPKMPENTAFFSKKNIKKYFQKRYLQMLKNMLLLGIQINNTEL